MKKTVYIHIGSPKTATSSIQNYMYSNRDVLRCNGYLYPSNCSSHHAHHALCVDINKERGRSCKQFWYGDIVTPGTAWKLLIDEINESKQERIVISSELFFVMDEYGYELVKKKLSSFNVKIICFIRSEEQLFNSFYNQDIKGQRQWKKSAYEFYETHQLFNCTNESKIKSLEKVFGSEAVKLYPFVPKKESTLKRFLGGLEISNIYNHDEERHENQGLGPNSLYVKRILNLINSNIDLNENYIKYIKNNISSDDQYISNMVYINKAYYLKWYNKWHQDRVFLESKSRSFKDLPAIKNYDELVPFSLDKAILLDFIRNCIKGIFCKRKEKQITRCLIIKLVLLICIENGISIKSIFYEK